MRHGGAQNRPGTEYSAYCGFESGEIRLVPFQIDSTSSCVLEFGGGPTVGKAGYMRVHKEGAPVLLGSKAISGWNYGTTYVRLTVSSHGYSNGDQIYISGAASGEKVNGNYYNVSVVDASTLQLYQSFALAEFIDSSAWTETITGGTVEKVYELATGIINASLPDIQFAQKENVLTVVHPDNDPIEITRTSDTSWAKATISFGPSLSFPNLTYAGVGGTAGSNTFYYKITSVSYPEAEESLPTAALSGSSLADPTAAAPIKVQVTSAGQVSGAGEYNIYRAESGVFGLLGVGAVNTALSTDLDFYDIGQSIDTSRTPPSSPGYFVGVNQVPGVVAYFQQRLILAATNSDEEKVWMSRTGYFKNFTIRSPIQDDDSIVFSISGKQIQSIKHIVDIGRLVMFTTSGEWTLEGSDLGVLTPTTLNLKQQSYNGASSVPPLVITNSCLYVQARGSIVRDFGYDFQSDGYKGNDLTLFSSHLFDGYDIDRWTYQQVPHSNVWAARSDGTLLCLTYLREQSMVAWSRHDMDAATASDVTSISEQGGDFVYMLVSRTISGVSSDFTRVSVERMSTREFSSVVDAKFVDASVTYDGRNTGATTITLSGGTNWTYDETLTITASTSYFAASDVGSEIHLTNTDGDIIRMSIDAYTSATVVSGKPHKTVPAGLQATATTSWSKAVTTVSGLLHLEGLAVAILGDGFVVASPDNSAYDTVTVADGYVTLDKAYAVIHVGRPYICDIETLDIDVTNAETLINKNKNSGEISIMTEETRGLWAGSEPPSDDDVDPLEGLREFKMRNNENYESPISLHTGPMETLIKPQWNNNGRVFIRQVDPLPSSVLAIAPTGQYPIRK